MMFKILSLILIISFAHNCGGGGGGGRDDFYYDVFPQNFQWGLGTSAYQIEGAIDLNGKGPSIWDVYTHQTPPPIADGGNGDLACDSYNLYKEDVAALKNMGANFYRFSFSWSRLLPDGTAASLNPDGVAYYNRLIDELLANGIEPFVTLYVWDLPQPLMDAGGWLSEDIAYHFAEYARIAFENFGDRVKKWTTFNEIYVFCKLGYGDGVHAPGIAQPAEAPYQCAHTAIKAHGLAYRLYDAEFRPAQNGQIGMILACGWNEPADRNNPKDIEASHRSMKFENGWIAHPILYGEYPPIMRQMVDEKSLAEGRNVSRLPSFDEKWTEIINGTVDFIGLNHYSTNYVNTTEEGGPPGVDGDGNIAYYSDPEWPASAAAWLNVVPWGFRRILNWLAMEYGNLPLYVTENGFVDKNSDGLNDTGRINYFNLYINEMLKAVKIDGVNVKGYSAWSLVDNFEWAEGYTQRFGLHYIDFANGNLTRVPKDSVKFLANIFAQNGFPPSA